MLECILYLVMYGRLLKIIKRFDRPFNRRIIDINAPSLSHISMDIKHMPPINKLNHRSG